MKTDQTLQVVIERLQDLKYKAEGILAARNTRTLKSFMEPLRAAQSYPPKDKSHQLPREDEGPGRNDPVEGRLDDALAELERLIEEVKERRWAELGEGSGE